MERVFVKVTQLHLYVGVDVELSGDCARDVRFHGLGHSVEIGRCHNVGVDCGIGRQCRGRAVERQFHAVGRCGERFHRNHRLVDVVAVDIGLGLKR